MIARPRLLAVVLVLTIASCRKPSGQTLTISVAASLQNAMNELTALYARAQPGISLSVNFGGSGALEQQIESGAPTDVFLPAAPKPMDRLAAKGLILADTRRELLRNQLVLVAPKDSAALHSFEELTGDQVKLIALGDPASVPAGDYGRQVLEALRLWGALQPKLVLAKDVRQVLAYVETANTDAGIVYETDARESNKVRLAAIAPPETHKPIVYPVAVVKDSRNVPAARSFIDFLAGSAAGEIFRRHGFTTVTP